MHNAQGPNNSITQSDVSSLLALGEACRILRRGQADFMLVGGAESKINPLSFARNCLFAPLSKRNDAPEKASRPFEKNRDGMVLAEGGGVVIVEDLDHAKKRGARIYAEVVGFGAAFHGFGGAAGGKAVDKAIHAALAQANLQSAAIDHVNAHGLSTIPGDTGEAEAIGGSVGRNTPVFAAKSYLGNTGAGCGVIELALRHARLCRKRQSAGGP